MTKIIFDLEEFKDFLEELEDFEYDSSCRARYEYHKYTYELNDNNEVQWRHYVSKYGDEKYKLLDPKEDTETMIKGEIIDD